MSLGQKHSLACQTQEQNLYPSIPCIKSRVAVHQPGKMRISKKWIEMKGRIKEMGIRKGWREGREEGRCKPAHILKEFKL